MKKYAFTGLMAVSLSILIVVQVLAEQACTKVYGTGKNRITLATGSPGSLGLLKALADAFNAKNDSSLCWIKAGSGASLKLLKDRRVDMIMVHAPEAEKKAVMDGWAVNRTLIGSNEFFIVGPKDDPAKVSQAKTAAGAYKRIAEAKAKFFSRGDNSGTHKKEMMIWKRAGIAPTGSWYVVTKDFMKPTLRRANSEKGYFMTDSSTWIAEKKNLPNLVVLFKGDPVLINTYHALCAPAGTTPSQELAAKFVEFIASQQGQQIVGDYGKDKYGEGLYNDAAYARKYGE